MIAFITGRAYSAPPVTAGLTVLLPAASYFLIHSHHHLVPNLDVKGMNARGFQGCTDIRSGQSLALGIGDQAGLCEGWISMARSSSTCAAGWNRWSNGWGA